MATHSAQRIPPAATVAERDVAVWTYGAEYEWSDWDRRNGTGGCPLDLEDVTMVNSNGIAVDPQAKVYPYGGEIATPPYRTVAAMVAHAEELVTTLRPRPVVNYRSNLHVHVRIPGLAGDLETLKALQLYVYKTAPGVFAFVERIPVPVREEYLHAEEYVGAVARYERRRRSHQMTLPRGRVMNQLVAKTLTEFYEAEVPRRPNGTPAYHLQPRAAINLRQLLQTETIEFRHFPGTVVPEEIGAAVTWCQLYLQGALVDQPLMITIAEWREQTPGDFPLFEPYVHWMELRYKRTTHDGSVPRKELVANVEAILREDQ